MGRYFHDFAVPGNDICIPWHGVFRCTFRSAGIYSDFCAVVLCACNGNLRTANQEAELEVAGDLCNGNQYARCNDLCDNYHATDRVTFVKGQMLYKIKDISSKSYTNYA